MSATVTVRRGSIYIAAETAERYFRSIEAVIILVEAKRIRILPVHRMASGGCLLKVRNAAGDRVASAPDAFAEQGLAEWSSEDLPAFWSSDAGALLVPLPEILQTIFA